MKDYKKNIYFKIAAIILLAFLLMIPTAMIEGLIHERENTQTQAIKEVSNKWGDNQTITGPIITIPYNKYTKEYSTKGVEVKTIQTREYIHILPTELKINGKIKPELRNRAIYEIVVYDALLDLTGYFDSIKFAEMDIPTQDILFDKATLSVGITDLRGIEKQINLKWNDNDYLFNPGVANSEFLSSGLSTPIKINAEGNAKYNFSLSLDLKGSQLLYFTPIGKVTDITLNSSWNNPSFNGAFLPDTRHITNAGFDANWNILNLNRNYPQVWINQHFQVKESNFGVDLVQPVDNYQKTFRSIKYAILFIGLTFMVFFFIEILNNVFIHPIQYILVGMALVIFYTLLLSISEHLYFNYAFIISAISTLLLIAGYVKSILKTTPLVILISGILGIMYTFIFVIIQLQDFALLMGSIGIFLILGMVMYFSRKIDWSNLNIVPLKSESQTNI